MTATRYAGPRRQPESPTRLNLAPVETAKFHREGLRENFEYRDLGLSAATGGRVGAKHTRAVKPWEAETGWHWHDMDVHAVFVIRGHITFRFRGLPGEHVVRAGECITQPAGVPHNVVDRSADLELLELTLPQRFSSVDLPSADDA